MNEWTNEWLGCYVIAVDASYSWQFTNCLCVYVTERASDTTIHAVIQADVHLDSPSDQWWVKVAFYLAALRRESKTGRRCTLGHNLVKCWTIKKNSPARCSLLAVTSDSTENWQMLQVLAADWFRVTNRSTNPAGPNWVEWSETHVRHTDAHLTQLQQLPQTPASPSDVIHQSSLHNGQNESCMQQCGHQHQPGRELPQTFFIYWHYMTYIKTSSFIV